MPVDRSDCQNLARCVATTKGLCRACRRIHLDKHPELRARMSEASKKALADPEVRARMSDGIKKAWADPELRARMSAARKKAWADPELRARMSEARKKALADPEARARMSEASKKAWLVRNPWCPPERREEYRLLAKALGAKEARSIIERGRN